MTIQNSAPTLPFALRGSLCAAILGFLAAVSVARGTDLFREAEEADDTNMATDGAYHPQTPEEAAKLSGQRWLNGKVADSPLYADYDLKVPEAGAYHFFLRKFWQHGAFRWRIDNGDWREVRKSELLDSVVMRQYVPLNWVSLGDITLTAGPHKLRFEVARDPSYEYSDAYGFDCLLLTQGELRDYLEAHPGLGGETK